MRKYIFSLLIVAILTSCKNDTKNQDMMPVEPNGGIGDGAPSIENAIVAGIEKAHHKQDFTDHEMVSFDLKLDFGGKTRFNGKVSMLTNSGKIKVEKQDGTILLYDGDKMFSTQTDNLTNDRFDLFTWPYFFAFPYKLSDPGTVFALSEKDSLMGKSYETFTLKFEDGTGDSPDDWYVGYVNNDQLVRAAAYIVTFNNTQKKAEEAPHAIVYSGYKDVDEIPIAHHWEFYNWSKENGVTGAPIGMASLDNVTFSEAEEDFFKTPEGATVID